MIRRLCSSSWKSRSDRAIGLETGVAYSANVMHLERAISPNACSSPGSAPTFPLSVSVMRLGGAVVSASGF